MQIEELEAFASTTTSSFAQLPEDVMLSVIPHLPLVDRLHLALTCRWWRSIVLSASKYCRPPRGSPPRLMHLREGTLCNFRDPVHGAEFTLGIPGLAGARVVSCRDGWLLLSRRRDRETLSLFFMNPFTAATIELPDVETWSEGGFSFSAAPTSPSCVVVGVNDAYEYDVFVYVCRRGDGEWDADLKRSDVFCLGLVTNPTFYRGSFYCLANDGYLAVFNPETDAWTLLRPAVRRAAQTTADQHEEEEEEEDTDEARQYLVESEGELLRVMDLGGSAHVLKLSPSMDEWAPVESLGDRSLFVSRLMSTSAKAIDGGFKEGTIYFNKLVRGKKGCVAYYYNCAMDRSSARLPVPDPRGFQKTKEFIFGVWIQLEWAKHSPEELQWHNYN